jgi:hypothetical protein
MYDAYHEGFNAPHIYLVRGSFRATSNLPNLSFHGDLGFHFVALPSGEFKATRDVPLNVDCRG